MILQPTKGTENSRVFKNLFNFCYHLYNVFEYRTWKKKPIELFPTKDSWKNIVPYNASIVSYFYIPVSCYSCKDIWSSLSFNYIDTLFSFKVHDKRDFCEFFFPSHYRVFNAQWNSQHMVRMSQYLLKVLQGLLLPLVLFILLPFLFPSTSKPLLF